MIETQNGGGKLQTQARMEGTRLHFAMPHSKLNAKRVEKNVCVYVQVYVYTHEKHLSGQDVFWTRRFLASFDRAAT